MLVRPVSNHVLCKKKEISINIQIPMGREIAQLVKMIALQIFIMCWNTQIFKKNHPVYKI